MQGLRTDLRYGLRQMRSHAVLTVTAVVTLALGIGATSTIFSVVNRLILRPLPYEDAERLVIPWRSSEEGPMLLTPDGELLATWRAAGSGFEAIEAFSNRQRTETGRGEPRILDMTHVSAGFFGMLRVRPVLGRGLLAADEAAGAERVVVLGEAHWRSAYGGDADAIGRSMMLDGESWTIVGVVPDAELPHGGTRMPQVWAPLSLGADGFYEARGLLALGRLREGVPAERAQAELSAATARLLGENETMRSVRVQRPADLLGTNVHRSLAVLLGAVTMVLLIACANVANLLLAGGAARRDELAVRAAIGAGPGRLFRQLLVESLLLATVGGAVGIALAFWGLDLIIGLRPDSLRELERVTLDGRVLGFTVVLTAATGVAFGILPALRGMRAAFPGRLRTGARTTGPGRTSAALIAAEVALSLVLMVGAGLLIRSLAALESRPQGFEPDGLVTTMVRLPASRYATESARQRFLERFRDAAAELPGVRAATLALAAPPGYAITFAPLEIEGLESADAPGLHTMNLVEPAFFDMLGIRMVAGRPLRATDVDAVVVNASFAALHFPDGAVGRRMRLGEEDDWHTIVGVSADLPTALGDAATRPQLHYATSAEIASQLLILDTDAGPAALRGPLADIAARIDPGVALDEVTTMSARLAATLERPRFNLVLLGALAALALVLSAVGLYGVVRCAVAERTREIGIRRALGAPIAHVVTLAVRQGLVPAAIGAVAGLAGALVLARFMGSMLYGFGTRDPLTLTVVPLVLGAVAAAACVLPARRAARVEPAIALRNDV